MTLPMDLANFPSLLTKKALLLLDLQNDFLLPEGGLPVTQPEGFLDRTMKLTQAFRNSGAGDIIWITSQFDVHRPTAEAQIMASDALPSTSSRSRGRAPTPQPNLDDDVEAFLSVGSGVSERRETQRKDKREEADGEEQNHQTEIPRQKLLLPGSEGVKLVSSIDAVRDRHDLVLAKSHYSAFESGQLLRRLRTRFVTELYICGALTNISVYATALDAASHGLALTIVEDCCGYRSELRHLNALKSLEDLTGCESISASEAIASFQAATPGSAPDQRDSRDGGISAILATLTAGGGPPDLSRSSSRSSSVHPVIRRTGGQSARQTTEGPISVGKSTTDILTGTNEGLPVRTKVPEPEAGGEEKKTGGEKIAGNADTEKKREKEEETKVATNASSAPVPASASAPQIDSELSALSAATLPKAQPETTRPVQPLVAKVDSSTPTYRPAYQTGNDDPIEAAADSDLDDSEELLAQLVLASRKKRAEYAPRQRKHAPLENKGHGRGTTLLSKAAPPKDCLPAEKLATKAGPEMTATSTNSEAPSQDSLASLEKAAGLTQLIANDPICEGDTIVYHNVLSAALQEGIYERLRDEVQWLRMSHQGGEVPRLVCVQGCINEQGDMPVYRHPADESPPLEPFTPSVVEIKEEIEKIVGHPINHALIQLYRTGHDYISEHSDKTLDIVPGSYICNMSVGAERTMIFRTKRRQAKDSPRKDDSKEGVAADHETLDTQRQSVRVQLPHNSLCRVGLQTNKRWLHAIRQDKRAERDKSAPELAFGGGRISLTFRYIGTFLNREQTLIWGQGAVAKTRETARPVVNGQGDEAIQMLRAFGTENQSSHFDWQEHYGQGFDVLHMSSSPRFFAGTDLLANTTIQLFLAHLGISYAKGSLGATADKTAREDTAVLSSPPSTSLSLDAPVKFTDNDAHRSTVHGLVAILLYLDAMDPSTPPHVPAEREAVARKYARFQQALQFQDHWRKARPAMAASANITTAGSGLKSLKTELSVWNTCLLSATDKALTQDEEPLRFLSGCTSPSLADFLVWPVLYDMAQTLGGEEKLVSALKVMGSSALAAYYVQFKAMESVNRVWASLGN